MKTMFSLLTVLLLCSPPAWACTNFPINIGVIDTPEGRILAESLAILINERSGVTVGTHYFNTPEDMAKALNEKRLEMLIENTSAALRQMNLPVAADPEQNLETVKERYKELEMIWLQPFAFRTTDAKGVVTITASVISRKALTQFPALPRLIGKLSEVIDDEAMQKLVKGVRGEKKPRNEAKEFLVKQSLI